MFLRPSELQRILRSDAVLCWGTRYSSPMGLRYAAPYWFELYPTRLRRTQLTELRCTCWAWLHLLSFDAPAELRCALLSYSAPHGSTLHPSELQCIYLNYRYCTVYNASSEATLSSAEVPGTLHPTWLRCALLICYALPSWATLHLLNNATPDELRCTLLRYATPAELCWTYKATLLLLSYSAPAELRCTCWASLHLLSFAATELPSLFRTKNVRWKRVCLLLSYYCRYRMYACWLRTIFSRKIITGQKTFAKFGG